MTCSSTGYTGQNFCNKKSRFGKPTGIIFARSSHTEIAADFLLEATWVTEVQAQNVFPLHNMKNFEDNSTEAQYHEYADGSRKLMEQGDYRLAAYFDVNECTKKQLAKFRGFNEGIYLVYGDVIRGRSIDSGVNIVPIRVDELNVEKATFPAMDGTPEMLKITIDLADFRDVNDYDYSREMAWDVKDVDGLTEVNLSLPALPVVQPTADLITVDVAAECGGDSKGIAGLGLTAADWTIGSGTISEVTVPDSTKPYRYAIAGALMAGDVDLAAPNVRSDDVLVISSGAIASGI